MHTHMHLNIQASNKQASKSSYQMYVHIHIELAVDELVYMPIYITYFSRIIIYQLAGSTRRDVYDSIYGPEYSGTLVYICSGDIYVS